ncbi:hypothetical protein LAZ67_3002058, partial [Cordylochernes scorpioides]
MTNFVQDAAGLLAGASLLSRPAEEFVNDVSLPCHSTCPTVLMCTAIFQCKHVCNNVCKLVCNNVCKQVCNNVCKQVCNNVVCNNVCKQVSNNVCKQVCNNVCKQVCNNVCKQVCNNVCKQVCNNVCKLVCNNVCKQVSNNVCKQVCNNVCKQVCHNVCKQVCNNVCKQVCNNVCKQVCNNVCKQVCNNVCKQVCSNVCKQVCSNVCKQVCSNVCKQVCNNVCKQVCNNVCKQVCNNVCKQLLAREDLSAVRFTPQDDDIYSEFRKQFPNLNVTAITEEELKSAEAKKRWREFCEGFSQVEDFNFGTMLRLDSLKEYSEDNSIFGLMRQEKLKEFKFGMKKQQFMFTKVSQESEAAVHANYVLSEMIAKHSKPFTEGDFIKECLIKAAEIVCPGSVKTFQAISLSRNTVVERVTDMARNLNDQIKEKSSCFEAFSIACDESTDIGGVAQLVVFFRACDMDLNIFEELLELVPMHGTTTEEDIFNCVYDLLQKYNLPQSKLTSVATDGVSSMTGKTNGFVALLRKKLSEISDGSNVHHTHCIIHQEVLCTKVIKMENVLTPIKKFINFIRSRGLFQRQFSLFLTELESEYSGLSYYTKVRWLSCSKVLKQFWDLKEEICQFLITNNQDITLFSDQVWLQDFSFMVDITKHLSDLNLKLQGKDQIITNMCDQVNAFKCKLVLWEKKLKNEDLMHFPTCNMYKSSLGETASYQKYAEKILSLRNEFETRFSDFKSLEGKFTLFSSIFSINIESVPNHMQMEVIDIQCDSDLKAKFIEVGVSEFYKYLPARFENTRKLAYEIMSMFGSTYRCKQLFSLMKGNKSPIRSRITDVHLGHQDPVLRYRDRQEPRRSQCHHQPVSPLLVINKPSLYIVITPHVYTRPCGHASRELPSFSPLASGITSRMATNLARAESPSNAEQKPVRHGAKAQPCAELSKKEDFQKKTSNLFNKNQNYANPPAGGHHANPATPTDFVTASFSEAAAQANRSWADLAEDNNQESEDPFITVQRKKRRRGSAESPAAAAPSSNIRGAGAIRRPRSSTGWAPRAEEIRTTRAHIVEARARQASSTEDHCVYVERSPELEPFHYMRAIERMFGGTREVFQLTKMNGHFLVGLANRGMAERLVNEGLEVEGTLHRAFPFRKRAERITVGNLPFFVGDAAVISALSSFGRVTSIAPKLMKAGPYIYNDGRREAFIILREGMTIERLPTRLDITIKGEAWPAYLSSGIRCSRCRGQGHRRANCPLLARRTTAPGPATPTSPTSVPPATAPRLPQQPSAQPPPPASPSPTMEVSDVPPTSRAALHPPAALRQSSPAPSALPAEDAPLAPPPMTPAPSLRTPGSREPAAPTPDVEMSIVEETSASFTSTAKNATRIDLDAFIERHPSVSFAETDALGLGREEVLDLLSSRTKTQRSVPLLPLSQCNALAGLIRQILDLRPGAASNLYKVLGQVKAELRTTPAAVPPTPPLPAPRPAEPMLPTTHREELTPPLMTPPPPAPTDMEEDDPMTEKERDTPPPPAPRLAETTPPIPHGEKTSPHIATPPPPLSCQFIDDRWTEADDILYELNQERDWGVGISESDITEAVIYPEDREPLIRRLSTRRRSLLAAFISAAIERARDADPFVREGMLGSESEAVADLSAENHFQGEDSRMADASANYANLPIDRSHANFAAACIADVTPSTSGALAAATNWAEQMEAAESGEDSFTVVKHKRRRRESPNHPVEQRSSGVAASRRTGATPRRRPTAGGATVVQEIRATRADIADARVQQRSSTEDNCVFVEHCPDFGYTHYLQAVEELVGGAGNVLQVMKMDGHMLVGLSTKALAERLLRDGLEIGHTHLRAFPFKKRAERITVANLPFFVDDAAVIEALKPFGDVSSIAPIRLRAGRSRPASSSETKETSSRPSYHMESSAPDAAGRVTVGPTAPSILGEPPTTASHNRHPLPPGASSTVSRQQSRPTPAAPALPMEETPSAPPPVTPAPPLQAPEGPVGPRPAGSQHPEPPPARPDLVGPLPAQKTLGPAAPTPDVEMSIVEETFASSTSLAKNATRVDLDAFIEGHPSVSFAETDALGLGREEVLDLLSSRTKAQRKGPLLSPPQCDALAGLIRQILDLRPGAASNLYKVLGQVKAELRTTPTAVSPTPPLPAPRPAEPTPPAPHGKMTTPALATSPLFQVEEDLTSKRWDEAADIIYKLCNERYSGPLTDLGITEGDITDAVIYPEDREPLLRTCSTQKKNLITEIISAAIERARDSDPF